MQLFCLTIQELEFFFPSTIGYGPSNTAIYKNSACCIIKPHAISEGREHTSISYLYLQTFQFEDQTVSVDTK